MTMREEYIREKTMKALQLTNYMEFEYIEVETPLPAADEVLIRIKAAAVCGSDIAGAGGSTGRRKPPIIMGHEASGVVEHVGEHVTRFSAGDRVSFDSTIYCGNCKFCRSGQVNLCEDRRVLGVSCEEYRKDGAFCQYIAVPERVVYKIPQSVTFDEAALLEPISVAFHAVRRLEAEAGQRIALFGTGTIALFAVQIIKELYDAELIVIGRNQLKLELAKELGADYIVHSKSEPVKTAVERITKKEGVERALDAAGASETFRSGMEILQKGGIFVTLANLQNDFSLNASALITRELTIKGSCAFNEEFPKAIAMLSAGKIRTDYAVSHRLALKDGGAFIKKIYETKPDDFFKCLLHP